MTTKLILSGLVLATLLLPACSVQTKEDGNRKDVKIDSVVGDLRVKTDEGGAPDVGLAVYPGAEIKQDGEHKGGANVDLNTSFLGLRVKAATYTTADSQDKVQAFYERELARFGTVVVCRGEIEDRDSGELYCKDGRNHDTDLQLAVGRKDNQHIVALKNADKGTEFSLVHIRVREGKEEGRGEMM